MTEQRTFLPLVIITGIVSISFAGPVTSMVAMPAVAIALFRLSISFIILLPFFIREITNSQFPEIKLIKLSLLASVFLALHFIFWISSLKYTSVTSSVVLVTTNPLFVGILSALLLRERPGKKLIIAISIVLLGGIIISSGEEIDSIKIKGNLLALAGAVMASLYIITTRKARQNYSLVTYTTVLYLFTSGILLIAALISDTKLFYYPAKNYLLILFLAIVPQLLGHNSFNWALKYLSPTVVAILILFEPIGATIISHFIFGYIPSTGEIIGSALILTGILVSLI